MVNDHKNIFVGMNNFGVGWSVKGVEKIMFVGMKNVRLIKGAEKFFVGLNNFGIWATPLKTCRYEKLRGLVVKGLRDKTFSGMKTGVGVLHKIIQ